eukprot:1646434-Rhodomonas_salina.1
MSGECGFLYGSLQCTRCPVPACASPTQCPVLPSRMLYSLSDRALYAMSGTEIAGAARRRGGRGR